VSESPIRFESGRRRDLEAVMTDEVPGLTWRVHEVASTTSPQGGFRVRTDAGVQRYVRDLTSDLARTLAHQMALAVRLRE
jgi:hypothetical protein